MRPISVKEEVHALEEKLKQLVFTDTDSSDEHDSSNSEDEIEMIAHDSTHSSASSSSSECTSDCSGLCCNVLTIQEENDLYTTLLSTTDRRTRKTIQDILANKSGEKEKEKQKTDPQAYINASVERTNCQ